MKFLWPEVVTGRVVTGTDSEYVRGRKGASLRQKKARHGEPFYHTIQSSRGDRHLGIPKHLSP